MNIIVDFRINLDILYAFIKYMYSNCNNRQSNGVLNCIKLNISPQFVYCHALKTTDRSKGSQCMSYLNGHNKIGHIRIRQTMHSTIETTLQSNGHRLA